MTFAELVASIPQIGLDWHRETILANSIANAPHIKLTIRDIPPYSIPALIISAGPSLYRENILKRLAAILEPEKPEIHLIATDGAYIQCLKAGILPDFVITLDPHPTRMVRWFGDPDYSENAHEDSYFARQDLDVRFRENPAQTNAENIRTVDENLVPLVICSTAPQNVVARTSRFLRYWFAPLVDSPAVDGLTRAICKATGLPALNTGGTVGTAAWCFAREVLKSPDIAVVGMDMGYYMDTPFDQTQSWNMLKGENHAEMYPHFHGPMGTAYTDPTYAWYRQNFLDLLAANDARITNCSEHGLLYGEGVDIMRLEEWLTNV